MPPTGCINNQFIVLASNGYKKKKKTCKTKRHTKKTRIPKKSCLHEISSGFSTCDEFKHSKVPSYPYIISCAKGKKSLPWSILALLNRTIAAWHMKIRWTNSWMDYNTIAAIIKYLFWVRGIVTITSGWKQVAFIERIVVSILP